jgi:hypothetical protein
MALTLTANLTAPRFRRRDDSRQRGADVSAVPEVCARYVVRLDELQ